MEQGLHRAREATAPLWPELVIAHGRLDEAAQILANPDGADSATVQARYQADFAEATTVTADPGPAVSAGS